jgi:hypothetical protein
MATSAVTLLHRLKHPEPNLTTLLQPSEYSAYLHFQVTNLRECTSLRRDCIVALRELYADLFPPDLMLADAKFCDWLTRYEFGVIAESIEAAAVMYHRSSEAGQTKTKLDIIRYASACMGYRTQN